MPEEMAERIGIGHLRGKGYRVGVGGSIWFCY